jgi:molecular chaperone IbpA
MEDVTMRHYDLTPFWRSTVGFDRLFDLIEDVQMSAHDSHPPYDIVRTGNDEYQITLALAGFAPDDVTITAEQNTLAVEGRREATDDRDYLYRGIPIRPFRRVFNLAEFVEVKGATFEGGLLKIDLARNVPESMKPRRIAINATGNDNQTIEQKSAA